MSPTFFDNRQDNVLSSETDPEKDLTPQGVFLLISKDVLGLAYEITGFEAFFNASGLAENLKADCHMKAPSADFDPKNLLWGTTRVYPGIVDMDDRCLQEICEYTSHPCDETTLLTSALGYLPTYQGNGKSTADCFNEIIMSAQNSTIDQCDHNDEIRDLDLVAALTGGVIVLLFIVALLCCLVSYCKRNLKQKAGYDPIDDAETLQQKL